MAKGSAVRETQPLRVAAGHRQRFLGDIDAQPGRVGQFAEQRQQQATGAGAEVSDRQRRLAVRDGGQRRLDQGLAVGPRVQGRRRDLEIEAPEFAAAGQVRQRLARGPARDQAIEAGTVSTGRSG